MRFPGMTTRRWMIAVAVVGALLGIGIESRLIPRVHEHWSECRLRASWYEEIEIDAANSAKTYMFKRQPPCAGPATELSAEEIRQRLEYERTATERSREEFRIDAARYRAIKRSLRRASWRPWEPIPDTDILDFATLREPR